MAEPSLIFELNTDDESDAPVYLTGNFNNWQVRDEQYRMQYVGAGKYLFTFPVLSNRPPVLEYKYIRTDWDGEELDAYGQPVSNRTVSIQDGRVVDHVPHWKSHGLAYKPELLPDIRVISENFEIPQLIKTRRIAALLPHNYNHTDRHYPVLYLQDGQNLFDDYAPFGNWAVDKKLALMAERGTGDIIIIAIDHAREERILEFTPSTSTRLGVGDGKKYVRFLTETLKPYVDSHFRTMPDREHTGIGGSSMGALISIYAGLMYPEVYSKLLLFSPSLWVAPNIHFHATPTGEALHSKAYIYAGGDESKNMVPHVKQFKQAMERKGTGSKMSFHLSIDPQGKHNEHHWGEEFPKAVEWLYFHH